MLAEARQDPSQCEPLVAGLAPASAVLVPPLAAVFRDARREATDRELATSVLARYAAGDAETLAELLVDADAKPFQTLFPVLGKHGERAVALLAAELDRELEPDWRDPPLDASWPDVPRAAMEAIAAAHGIVAERFAFCIDLPWDEFAKLAEQLSASGYRPTRVRPYRLAAGAAAPIRRAGNGQGAPRVAPSAAVAELARVRELDDASRAGILANPATAGILTNPATGVAELARVRELDDAPQAGILANPATAGILANPATGVADAPAPPPAPQSHALVAAVWTRDGKRWKLETDLPREQLPPSDAPAENDGLLPVDLAVAPSADAAAERRFLILWGEPIAAGEQRRIVVGPSEREFATEAAALAKQGFASQATIGVWTGAAGERRYLGIWSNQVENADALYNAACAAALAGQACAASDGVRAKTFLDRAIELLEKAVAQGYQNAQQLRGDVDLAGLHGDPKFLALVDRLEPPARYAAVWRADVEFESRLVTQPLAQESNRPTAPQPKEKEKSGDESPHSKARELAAQGFRPVAIAVFDEVAELAVAELAVAELAVAELAGAGRNSHEFRYGCSRTRKSSGDCAPGAGRNSHEFRYGGRCARFERLAAAARSQRGQRGTGPAASHGGGARAGERVWPLLEHRPDPRLRSYLLHRLAPYGAEPALFVARLRSETDVSRRRALALAMGEFARAKLLSPDERADVTAELAGWYAADPDAGIHAAAEWSLKQLDAQTQGRRRRHRHGIRCRPYRERLGDQRHGRRRVQGGRRHVHRRRPGREQRAVFANAQAIFRREVRQSLDVARQIVGEPIYHSHNPPSRIAGQCPNVLNRTGFEFNFVSHARAYSVRLIRG